MNSGDQKVQEAGRPQRTVTNQSKANIESASKVNSRNTRSKNERDSSKTASTTSSFTTTPIALAPSLVPGKLPLPPLQPKTRKADDASSSANNANNNIFRLNFSSSSTSVINASGSSGPSSPTKSPIASESLRNSLDLLQQQPVLKLKLPPLSASSGNSIAFFDEECLIPELLTAPQPPTRAPSKSPLKSDNNNNNNITRLVQSSTTITGVERESSGRGSKRLIVLERKKKKPQQQQQQPLRIDNNIEKKGGGSFGLKEESKDKNSKVNQSNNSIGNLESLTDHFPLPDLPPTITLRPSRSNSYSRALVNIKSTKITKLSLKRQKEMIGEVEEVLIDVNVNQSSPIIKAAIKPTAPTTTTTTATITGKQKSNLRSASNASSRSNSPKTKGSNGKATVVNKPTSLTLSTPITIVKVASSQPSPKRLSRKPSLLALNAVDNTNSNESSSTDIKSTTLTATTPASTGKATPIKSKKKPVQREIVSAPSTTSKVKSTSTLISAPKSTIKKPPSQLAEPVERKEIVNDDFCAACNGTGNFICCDSCPQSFHFTCAEPPLDPDNLPESEWFCNECSSARIDGEGIEEEKVGENETLRYLVRRSEESNPKCFVMPKRFRYLDQSTLNDMMDELQSDTVTMSKDSNAPKEKKRKHQEEGTSTTTTNSNSSNKSKPSTSNSVKKTKSHLHSVPVVTDLYTSIGKLKKESGYCHECGKFGLTKRALDRSEDPKYDGLPTRPILSCDICPLYWHLDCVEPAPLSTFPINWDRWRCPIHLDTERLETLGIHPLLARSTHLLSEDTIKLQFQWKCQRQGVDEKDSDEEEEAGLQREYVRDYVTVPEDVAAVYRLARASVYYSNGKTNTSSTGVETDIRPTCLQMQNYPPHQGQPSHPMPMHPMPSFPTPTISPNMPPMPFPPQMMMMRPPMMMPPPPPGPMTAPLQSASAPVEVGLPNRTLYLQNLPERHNPLKNLPPLLSALFSPYGPIKQIVMRKRVACHGQAWIIFERQEDAQKALIELQGTRIWGKSVVIRFARFKSDVVAVEEGETVLEEEKKRRQADKIERAKMPRMTRRQQLAQLMSNPSLQMNTPALSVSGPDALLPNKTLFLQNLPAGIPSPVLQDLFKRFPGFLEVRMVPNRPDVAFVEYESETAAGVARQALDRMEIAPGVQMRVTFARR